MPKNNQPELKEYRGDEGKIPSETQGDGFIEIIDDHYDKTDWGKPLASFGYEKKGKWVIHFDKKGKAIDDAWEKVKQGVREGIFMEAKFAKKNDIFPDQVIVIYTYDHEDKNDVAWIYDEIQKRDIAAGAMRPPAYITDTETRLATLEKRTQQEQTIAEFIPNHYNIPDNAYRMLQLLIKYQAKLFMSSLSHKKYEEICNDLLNAKDEKTVEPVFNRMKENKIYSPSILNKFEMASKPNDKLLEEANKHLAEYSSSGHSEWEAKRDKYCREIEGRLLRTEKNPDKPLDIETSLMKKEQSTHGPSEVFKYHDALQAVNQDFRLQAVFLGQLFSARENQPLNGADKESEQRNLLVKNINAGLNKIKQKIKGIDSSASDDLPHYRNQMLLVTENLAPLKKVDHSLWNYVKAALLALSFLVGIGFIITPIGMFMSKRNAGTVFFTHASDDQRTQHKSKQALKELGYKKRISKS